MTPPRDNRELAKALLDRCNEEDAEADYPPERWRVRWWGFRFEPRDLWIGVYWDYSNRVWPMLSIYVCIVPTLPLCVHLEKP